jgi:hypothetical protein
MKALAETLVFILISSIMYSQDLTGQWTGTLLVQGTALKVIAHVSTFDGKYTTTMDSPDQNANGIKITNTDFQYPNVKFEIPAADAIYEGLLTGNRITGKWIQSGTAFFLELSRGQLPDIQPKK